MSPANLGRILFSGLLGSAALSTPLSAQLVVPGLKPHLVCYYDFETPVADDPTLEADHGSSGTPLKLINGGAAMRNEDGAFPASNGSIETKQINPTRDGNDDWKAGVFKTGGVETLSAFASVKEITLMGWVKPTGDHLAPNSTTPDPSDLYNSVGLFGILTGDSDGHGVRALVEIITVGNVPKLVALGRRVDGGNSLILAADGAWEDLLPKDKWTHLAGTFDFDNGTMALYRNGVPLAAAYTSSQDRWNVNGGSEPDLSSATNPAGIKIAGSYPQNTSEKNPFNGRIDDLMFFDRKLSADEVKQQYELLISAVPAQPTLEIAKDDEDITLSWSAPTSGYILECSGELSDDDWETVQTGPLVDNDSLTVPLDHRRAFYRLRKPAVNESDL